MVGGHLRQQSIVITGNPCSNHRHPLALADKARLGPNFAAVGRVMDAVADNLIAALQERAFGHLVAPLAKLSARHVPIPSSPELEEAMGDEMFRLSDRKGAEAARLDSLVKAVRAAGAAGELLALHLVFRHSVGRTDGSFS